MVELCCGISWRSCGTKIALATAILLGVLVGLSSYTFNYAEGLSYLSNDPAACVNCHIMNDEYNG